MRRLTRHAAAQVLATFDNGRVEAFLDMRTLEPADMADAVMAARIARRLKHFHAAKVALPGVDPGQPETFATIRKWCVAAVWRRTLSTGSDLMGCSDTVTRAVKAKVQALSSAPDRAKRAQWTSRTVHHVVHHPPQA